MSNWHGLTANQTVEKYETLSVLSNQCSDLTYTALSTFKRLSFDRNSPWKTRRSKQVKTVFTPIIFNFYCTQNYSKVSLFQWDSWVYFPPLTIRYCEMYCWHSTACFKVVLKHSHQTLYSNRRKVILIWLGRRNREVAGGKKWANGGGEVLSWWCAQTGSPLIG